MTKTYTHENLTYGAKGPHWSFAAPNYFYSTPDMPGGAQTAHKVARVIAGSLKRSGDMDNLARANVAAIIHRAAHPVSNTVKH